MTLRPSSSRYLIHMRTMSPQSGLPTVPTASASVISPRFCGFAMACWRVSSFMEQLVLNFHLVAREGGINLDAPAVNATSKTLCFAEAVADEVGGGVQRAVSVM